MSIYSFCPHCSKSKLFKIMQIIEQIFCVWFWLCPADLPGIWKLSAGSFFCKRRFWTFSLLHNLWIYKQNLMKFLIYVFGYGKYVLLKFKIFHWKRSFNNDFCIMFPYFSYTYFTSSARTLSEIHVLLDKIFANSWCTIK